jgi:hypothetical protein
MGTLQRDEVFIFNNQDGWFHAPLNAIIPPWFLSSLHQFVSGLKWQGAPWLLLSVR